MRHYAYFFTRQDISPEYQFVQTAHAAFQLGVNSQRWTAKPPEDQQVMDDIKAEVTYFTVVGVRNLTALTAVEAILSKFDIKYEIFFEPDLNDGECTSIAVYPIAENKKGPLDAFNLLKIDKRG